MNRAIRFRVCGLVFAVGCWIGPTPVGPAEVLVDGTDERDQTGQQSFFLPLLFRTETSDVGLGVSYYRGQSETPADLFIGGYGTFNSSCGLVLDLARLRLAESRWFLDLRGAIGWTTDQRFYGDLRTKNGEIEGGTNESDPDDFFQGEGWNGHADFVFRYTLPIGQARRLAVYRYETEDGLLVGNPSGAGRWNPRTGGRTFLTLTPFYQVRTLEVTEDNIERFSPLLGLRVGDTADHKTNGIRLGLEYDNRDYTPSPAHGSLQRLGLDRDFGWFDSTGSWTSMEGEYRKHLSLGRSQHLRQNVFALRAWTAYSKSMERIQSPELTVVVRSPPSNMGATLGGSDRLRGYPTGRFSDRAAIYYSAEWRLIPRWDPFGKMKIARPLGWRWWQFVLIAELGRVAPTWQLSTLHEQMKWSAGVGARLMLGKRVFRLSLNGSDEAVQVWFLTGQSF